MGLIQISGSTQIIFTVKTFAALMTTMLTLFFGFYQLVAVPRMNSTDALIKEQKEQNTIFYQELVKVNTSIGTLNGSLDALIRERSANQPTTNTGGSFSSTLVNTKHTESNKTTAQNIKN